MGSISNDKIIPDPHPDPQMKLRIETSLSQRPDLP